MAVRKQATGSRLAQLHLGLGRLLASLGTPALAAFAFRDAVRAEPRLAQAHFALGEALGRKGRWGEAAAAYATAARLRGNAEYQGNLVYALGRAFLWRDALQACDRFGELLAEDADVLLLRGLILRRLGRANEAILSFRRGVQLPAVPCGRRFGLGEALFGGDAWRAAAAALSQARGIGPTEAFGSRLNAAPARREPAPRAKRVAQRRRLLAGVAPALRGAVRDGLGASWRSLQALGHGCRRAGLTLVCVVCRQPHHTLRALRSAQRIDGMRYFSSPRPAPHT